MPMTDEQREILERGIRLRKGAAEIAEEIGVSKNLLMQWAWKADLRWDWTPAELSRINRRNARMNPKRSVWVWGLRQRAKKRRMA